MSISHAEYNRVRKFVKKNPYNLEKVCDHFKDNKGIVLVAIRKDGYALIYASESLQRDEELIRIAIKTNGSVLGSASDILRNDKELVITAVRNHEDALAYASPTLKNDKDVVLIAVSKYGSALRFASDNLKNDRDVVIVAINCDADALRYASPTIRNDRDIVKIAIIRDRFFGFAFQGASETLQDDKELVLMAISKNPHILEYYASNRFRKDREIIYAAVSICSTLFGIASDDLKNDKELALFAISCPTSCNHTWCKYNDDGDYVPAIYHVSRTLINDIDFVFRAVNINGHFLENISEEIIISNYKLVVYAINTSGIDVLEYVPHDNYCMIKKKTPGYRCNHTKYSINKSGIIASSKYYTDDKSYSTYYKLYNHIKENVQRYENFSVFLQGVCIPRSQSTLKKYDFFHSYDFLKSIAYFIGTIISHNDYYIYKSVFDKINLL
jgi:hypothetical protein